VFAGVETDRARLKSAPGRKSEQTEWNKANRTEHAVKLRGELDHLNAWWDEQKARRQTENLPELDGIASWVSIDPEAQNADFLRGLGFEIIAEEEYGFVLVAASEETFVISGQALDNFVDLQKKKNGSPAKVYEIGQPETADERLKRILPPSLWANWRLIDDDQKVIADFGISCDLKQESGLNPQKTNESDDRFQKREDKKQKQIEDMINGLEALRLERERLIDKWVAAYNGEIKQCYDSGEVAFPDSFTVRVEINGKGFKDIVCNFPYLFQIENVEEVDVPDLGSDTSQNALGITIYPPENDAPSVCVIDSGIMEEHSLLRPGIRPEESRNFIPGDNISDTADYVSPVGHGTQVAGAVLHPDSVFEEGEVRLAGFVQNARILDRQAKLPVAVQPAMYVKHIVEHYHQSHGTRIFNHSINANIPSRTTHMSTWAACIDKVSYENDILFLQSAGNISSHAIQEHLRAGCYYPDYLNEKSSRIANPAQSYQALTVGAIGAEDFETPDRFAIAGRLQNSPFSRSGPGIWDSIKPEVVAVGGDLVVHATDPVRVSKQNELMPVMVQSTLHGRTAIGRHSVGTSYAAPRIAALALALQKELPDESALLYRALIVNSARWPEWAEQADDKYAVLKRIGYGIPDGERALRNDEHRVTLVASGETIVARQAKLFQIPVPPELRSAASSFAVRIDVTLSYVAMPRRTRKGARQYLSFWADWRCSGKNQPAGEFRGGLFKDEEVSGSADYFPWMLRNDQHGIVKEARRNLGTVQKDWAVVDSHELPESFLIGVVGHPGWDTANIYPAKFALAVSFEAVNRDIEIYEPVRVLLDQLRVETERVRVDVLTEG
jgi:hypothetical protein